MNIKRRGRKQGMARHIYVLPCKNYNHSFHTCIKSIMFWYTINTVNTLQKKKVFFTQNDPRI